jgi:GxxExxY protein
MEHEKLTRAITGSAVIVHRSLGPGFLESVYQNALAWELQSAGIPVERERRTRRRRFTTSRRRGSASAC